MKILSIFIGLVLVLGIILLTVDLLQTWELLLVPIEVVELNMPTYYNYSKLEYIDTTSTALRYAITAQAFLIICLGCLLSFICRFEIYRNEKAKERKAFKTIIEPILKGSKEAVNNINKE